MVEAANPARSYAEIDRRIMKLGEEYGELLQAYLGVTSRNNYKNLQWENVREEMCDVLILALDIIMTRLPNEEHLSPEQIYQSSTEIIDRKIAKWHKNTSTAMKK